MQSSPEASDRLARRAAALAFATQGMVFISLTTRLPRFSDRWDLSEVQLSLVLLMIVLLAGAGSVVAERLAHHSSSASTLRAGLLTIGVAVPVVAAAPTGHAGRSRSAASPAIWHSASSPGCSFRLWCS